MKLCVARTRNDICFMSDSLKWERLIGYISGLIDSMQVVLLSSYFLMK